VKNLFENRNGQKLEAQSVFAVMNGQISETLPATGAHGKAILKWLKTRQDHIITVIDTQPVELVLALLTVDLAAFFEERMPAPASTSPTGSGGSMLAHPPSAPPPSAPASAKDPKRK